MITIASIIRNLLSIKQKKEEEKTIYNSHLNYIFYGEFAKSTTAAALSSFTNQPVLLISPAGGSSYLEADFPNIISYPVSNLIELEELVDDLTQNLGLVRKLHVAIKKKDAEVVANAKAFYEKTGEDWDSIYKLASEGNFPVSAVVIEECAMVSNWIQERLEDQLGSLAGQDKKGMGSEWNILKRRIMGFYGSLLKLPCTTIMATGSNLSSESQAKNLINPDLCTGSASRRLIDQVGNVFYFFKDDAGAFKVKLIGDKKVYAKDKVLSPYTVQSLPDEIDLTGRPELFWETLNDMRSKDLEDRAKSKLKNQKPVVKKK